MLNTLITSKTRMKLLLKFFSNPNIRAYLRGLAEELGENTNGIRVELNKLTEAGLLESKQEGNMIWYNANKSNPFYEVLNRLVMKYMGLEDILDNVINKLGAIELAYVSGDYASGLDSGTIELTIVSDNLDLDYLDKLKNKAEILCKRKIIIRILEPKIFYEEPGNFSAENSLVLLASSRFKHSSFFI